MAAPAFDPAELRVVDTIPATPFKPEIDVFDYPVTPREAMRALYRREPVWQPIGVESQIFTPRIFPDNVARGFVFENQPFNPDENGGGPDMFGIEWVYVPSTMGSMVRPGNPVLDDVNDWREVITFPNVDSWDWAGSAQENNGTYLHSDIFNKWWIQTGWFERLISFMDFENAAMAVVDDEQTDAVKDLFMAISNLYIDIIDHVHKYFKDVDAFYIHDDWGTSLDTFFDPSIPAEFIVPAMRKVTDHIHKIGCVAELHSCGNNRKQVANYIDAGWDSWVPQANVNDVKTLHEQYGDKLIFGAACSSFDPKVATEEEQRGAAREYADTFCNPQKPTMFDDVFDGASLTKAFREELYIQSRKLYTA